MCPEFAGPALRGLNRRRFRPENAHLRLPDRRKTTSTTGKGGFRNHNPKKKPSKSEVPLKALIALNLLAGVCQPDSSWSRPRLAGVCLEPARCSASGPETALFGPKLRLKDVAATDRQNSEKNSHRRFV